MMRVLLVLSLLVNLAGVAVVLRIIRKRGGWTFVRSWLVARGLMRDEAKERFERGHRSTKAELFDRLPIGPADIVFIGDSLVEGGPWHELLADARCKNRGIGGDTTQGVLDRIDALVAPQPAQVFLMVGVNDLLQGVPVETVIERYRLIVERVVARSPHTRLVIQGNLPLDPVTLGEGDNAQIRRLNEALRVIAGEHQATFVALYPRFEHDGRLAPGLTSDGLHLSGEGYWVWRAAIAPLLIP
jgi:lysophospholipase L1-like esterase